MLLPSYLTAASVGDCSIPAGRLMWLHVGYEGPTRASSTPQLISPSICRHKIIRWLPPTAEASRIRRPEHQRLPQERTTPTGRPFKQHDVGVDMNSRDIGPKQAFITRNAIRAPSHRARRLRACDGFTLIEVVVALAVVATMLTAIGAVVTTSSRGTRSLEQHLALVETTRIVEATLPRDDQASLDGLSGEILGHRWRISVAPFFGSGIYQIPDSPWIPQTVVVRVRSPSGAVYGFETVRLQRRPGQ